ncbi:MAG: hypothetical protein MK108_15910 [Mariniblastus sp.]|nr:hypothetical protein [Mariniblastus sp.]
MNSLSFLTRHLRVALLIAALGFAFPASTYAHFIWVYKANDGTVKIVFGEGLAPDQDQFLAGLSRMKVHAIHADGNCQPISPERKKDDTEGWFEIATLQPGCSLDVDCLYGMFGRGETQMLLNYGAKYIDFHPDQPAASSGKLPLDIAPSMVDGQLVLTALFNGKPAADVELSIYQLETDVLTETTSKDGRVTAVVPARYVVRAKHTVADAGEFEGNSYDEKRYYCTLVLDVHANHEAADTAQVKDEPGTPDALLQIVEAAEPLPDLPIGLTSFGGAVWNNQIFVFGGKEGKAHDYAKSYQNRQLLSLDAKTGTEDSPWREHGETEGLQGLALIAHNAKLYRIGGLDTRNAEGEDHDLHSVDSFCEFDPGTGKWKDLPKLPQGRSSFDACLVDDTIYVVGGWTMQGEEDSEWATDVLTYDLSNANAQWETIEAPFTVRALAARELNGKLYAIGGIDESRPTGAVHVLDLATRKWSEGPEVPAEGGMKAFGCSAAVVDGQLLVSTYDGGVYQLDEKKQTWHKIHELDNGRFFHQMLPLSDSRFALIGGAHMEIGKIFETEVFQCQPRPNQK